MWVDSSSFKVRSSFAQWNRDLYEDTIHLLRRYKVDNVSISTNQDYVKELISFFKTEPDEKKIFIYHIDAIYLCD